MGAWLIQPYFMQHSPRENLRALRALRGEIDLFAVGSEMGRQNIRTQFELEVYQMGFEASMRIFELSKAFPPEERYALTDQVRRSSRAVCANLAEAWRKRRYPAAFINKLSDSEAEAAETQVWLQYAVACTYIDPETGRDLFRAYDQIIGKLVRMSKTPDQWRI